MEESKDSNVPAPKRPLSPFLFYSQLNRVAVRRQHPELNTNQFGKLLSQLWKALPEEKKSMY
jgi:hypothetical protein